MPYVIELDKKMEVKKKLPENFEQTHLQYFEPNPAIDITEPWFKWLPKNVILLSNEILINRLSVEKESLLYNSRLKDIGGVSTLIKLIIKSIIKKK